jgi:hypothetical protein
MKRMNHSYEWLLCGARALRYALNHIKKSSEPLGFFAVPATKTRRYIFNSRDAGHLHLKLAVVMA